MVYSPEHRKEKQREATKRWRENNESKWIYSRQYKMSDENVVTMSYRSERFSGKYGQGENENQRISLLMLLGGKCEKCSENDHRCLQADHVNGGGCKERRLDGYKMHSIAHAWYGGLVNEIQLLCANDNWRKRYDNNEHGYYLNN